jgi:hypothetical protein
VRDPDTSLFDDEILDGGAPAHDDEIEVVLVEPDPTLFPPPWPAVILQHGFGGSNQFIVDNARFFLKRGMAVLGIDAVSHGRRGALTTFFRLDDPRVVRPARGRRRLRRPHRPPRRGLPLVRSGQEPPRPLRGARHPGAGRRVRVLEGTHLLASP